LGEACARIDPALAELAGRAEDLTEFAWMLRYPGEPEEPSGAEAADGLAVARAVYEAVLEKLPEAARLPLDCD
jgi:hypothetical protein